MTRKIISITFCAAMALQTHSSRAASENRCVAPSCDEYKAEAKAGEFSRYAFGSELRPRGYFRANLSITDSHADKDWVPFCYLSLAQAEDLRDSIQLAITKEEGKTNLVASIRTIRAGKVISQEKYETSYSFGMNLPFDISWMPNKFDMSFGDEPKTYTVRSTFTPKIAHLGCGAGAGTFQNIEQR